MPTEVAVPTPAGVPDLVRPRTAAETLTSDDLKLDRLYIGQAISEAVQQGLAQAGDLYTAQDKDDPSPNVLAKKGSKDGVVFHFLALRKGKSLSKDGNLVTWKYDDPNAPADAWTTYNYFIAIPSVDPDLPVRLLLTKSAKGAALKLNTIIHRASGTTPPYELAFRLTTAERSNDKGRYFVPLIQQVEDPSEEAVAVARTLYENVQADAETVDKIANSADPAI